VRSLVAHACCGVEFALWKIVLSVSFRGSILQAKHRDKFGRHTITLWCDTVFVVSISYAGTHSDDQISVTSQENDLLSVIAMQWGESTIS
jgi:hypothetical protein